MMGQICEFVLSNPQWTKAFHGFTKRDVIVKLVERRISGGISMATVEGHIRGIVIFDDRGDHLHIEHILGDRGMMRWALMMWRQEYPNKPVEFERVHRGKVQRYRLEFLNTVNVQTVKLPFKAI